LRTLFSLGPKCIIMDIISKIGYMGTGLTAIFYSNRANTHEERQPD
jgi:hypothetical protein